MGRRKFFITPVELSRIEHFLNTSTDVEAKYRLRAVLAYNDGEELSSLTKRFHCDRSTILNWCKLYRRCGPESLVSHYRGGNNARLNEAQLVELSNRLARFSPRDVFLQQAATPDGITWTAKDLYRVINLWYGVTYRSYSSYYRLLSRCAPHQREKVKQD